MKRKDIDQLRFWCIHTSEEWFYYSFLTFFSNVFCFCRAKQRAFVFGENYIELIESDSTTVEQKFQIESHDVDSFVFLHHQILLYTFQYILRLIFCKICKRYPDLWRQVLSLLKISFTRDDLILHQLSFHFLLLPNREEFMFTIISLIWCFSIFINFKNLVRVLSGNESEFCNLMGVGNILVTKYTSNQIKSYPHPPTPPPHKKKHKNKNN